MKTGEFAEPPDQVVSLRPRAAAAIRKLFDEDEEFRELCNDYADCVELLDQLRPGKEGVDDRVEQYCELRVNLETELLGWISSAPESPAQPAHHAKPDSHLHQSASGDRTGDRDPNP